MRIVFIDIHCINFLLRPYSQIKDNSKIVTYKHKFILDYAIKNNVEILSYISKRDSTQKGYSRIKKFIKNEKYFKREFEYVIDNSFYERMPINPIFDKSEILDTDIVIGYLYKSEQMTIMRELPGIKVIMGNHFISINEPICLDDFHVSAFVNEIDLSDNAFVNKYIVTNSKTLKYIKAPYIFADRFVNKHFERKNKAMAIGTLSTCHGNSGYKLYREFTGTEWIQPLRKMIYDNPDYMPDKLDSYIHYIFEDKIVINDDDLAIIKLAKRIKNAFTGWTQSSYMSFNMVDKFNEYSMFLCPEELIGMPGIGFVEGMACGTAYIGLDTTYYRDLGLKPGVNYITYDGTMAGLKSVIEYYQKHENELNLIATEGERYVREHFCREAVSRYFFEQLETLLGISEENATK